MALISLLIVMCLGMLTGLTMLGIAGMETRWLVYISGVFLFAFSLIIAHGRLQFLWVIFVLSFQFDVAVRVLHGYAGSAGIAVYLTFLAGLLLATFLISVRDNVNDGPFRWGGPLGFPIAALFLTYLLSLLLSSERFVGFSYLLTQLQYYAIYWLALNFIRTEFQLDHIIRLLLVTLAIQSLIYYIQSALGITFTLTGEVLQEGEIPRPGGTVATNPSGYASFILPLIFVATARFLTVHSASKHRWQLGILLGMAIGTLALTLTRAAWGSFFVGVGCLVILGYRRNILSPRRLLIIGAFVLIAAIAAAPMITARLDGAPLESSYNERAALMQMAIEVIKARPLTGVGPGAYGATYKEYLTPELAEKWLNPVHNHYLLRTAENGVAGGIAFVLLLAAAFRCAVKLTCSDIPSIQVIAFAGSAGILALAFEMFWDIWQGFTYNALLWFMFGLLGAAEAIDQRLKHQTPFGELPYPYRRSYEK